jgi:aspartyl/asparaginyl beta-hydroxylase (cupin superfamily)
MSTAENDLRAALNCLRTGDAGAARELFGRALAAGSADPMALVGMAHACRASGDAQGATAAIDRLLARDPRNVRGLILKGDLLADAGEARSASSYYVAAVRSALPLEQLPADLAAEVRRAAAACERYATQYQAYVLEQMAAKGFDPERSSRRFAQSLDIILGRKRIYLQEPKYYYFPGLPQIQFYEHDAFPWLAELEAATDDIRTELLHVMNEPDAFAPYVQGRSNRPRKEEAGMLNNPAWSAFYLWKDGAPVPENESRCPRTMQALRNAPLARVPNRSPSVLFSLLKPGAHIPPHNGLVNTRLICHLPLIAPPKCRFRVGNEEREWVHGRAWLFDDTIEHEAWNQSDETRVILLFDVWRPELTAEEHQLVISLFEAIDAHDGKKPNWSI